MEKFMYFPVDKDCRLSESSIELIDKILESIRNCKGLNNEVRQSHSNDEHSWYHIYERDLINLFHSFPDVDVYSLPDKVTMDSLIYYPDGLNTHDSSEFGNVKGSINDNNNEYSIDNTPLSEISALGEYNCKDRLHKPYISLYINSIRESAGGNKKNEDFLVVCTFFEEFMHAYLNRLPDAARISYHNVEIPIAEYGMLLLLSVYGDNDLFDFALERVRKRKYCPSMASHGFGFGEYLYLCWKENDKLNSIKKYLDSVDFEGNIVDIILCCAKMGPLPENMSPYGILVETFKNGYPFESANKALCDLYSYFDAVSFNICKHNPIIPYGVSEIGFALSDSPSKPLYYSWDSINIPPTVISLRNYAFTATTNLVGIDLPDTIKEIGIYAFYFCKNLKKVHLPETLTIIPDYLFDNCGSLKEFNMPANVTKIGKYAFAYCSCISEINLPSTVTSIESNAFRETGIKSMTIPNGVENLGMQVFEYCKNLTEVKLPDSLKIIDSGAFYGCENLTSIEIPNNVTEIRSNAFNGCKSLTKITIPASVKKIEFWAFKGCINLEITIKNRKTNVSIGEDAFEGCKSVKYLVLRTPGTTKPGGRHTSITHTRK